MGNSKSPLSVLLVENDRADAELCTYELRKAGFDVQADVVQMPEEFCAKAGSGRYDVVLADYNLPGWTGVEAFERLRKKDLDTPFILVTGAVGDEVAVECIKQGISDYVLKDRLARLPIAIRRALEEKSLREERARAEKMLVERERRFHALMEHSADGIVLLNARGEIVFTSHAENRILGYSAEERTGKSIFELVHPDDRPEVLSVFKSLLEKPGKSATLSLRYLTKDGSWRWLECIAINLLEEPSVLGIVINYRDISERKQAEAEIRRLNEELEQRVVERTAQLEAANQELHTEIAERRRAEKILRESQERFRLLVDGVKDYAIYMLDAKGRVVSWNEGAERIKGFRAEEIIGRSLACFYLPEEIYQGKPDLDLRTAEAEERLEIEGWKMRKDGSKFLANTVLTPMRDPAGKLRGFSNVTRDITERWRAHEALERLRLQQELILNSAGDGICGLDHQGVCTFVNPAGVKMLGWEGKDLIGKIVHEVLHHTKTDGTRYPIEECPVYAALQEGTTHHVTDEVFWRKDGSSFPVDYLVTPIRNEKGKILGAVYVFQDVSERRATERMKDEFVSVVSHELRTPLTAIRATLGLLATGKLCQAGGGCTRMVAVGVENADRLMRLVNDILDLERIESGLVTMEKKACNPANLMEKAVDLMRVTAETQGVTLAVHRLSATIWADPDRVMQVMINLLSNAIKFSPAGGAVSLSARKKDGEIVFQVQDQGRGIPANKLSRIFERFQQVDSSDSRQKGGTGLGLAICRSIVAQHGGRIWAESAPGQGSAFFFTIPAQNALDWRRGGNAESVQENIDYR